MDNIKLFWKKEKELETLIRITNEDIGMKFVTEKCAMFKIKKGGKDNWRNGTAKSRKNKMLGEKETDK